MSRAVQAACQMLYSFDILEAKPVTRAFVMSSWYKKIVEKKALFSVCVMQAIKS